ncbi:MAG: caspase family protein, partial [Bacteroidota bacterium]
MSNTENTRGRVKRTDDANQALPSGKNYLLAIAIDVYTHQPKLHNAVRDTEAVVTILQRRYSFEPTHTIKLYNKAANKPEIFGALERLAKEITSLDSLLIYYAGHGYFHPTNQTGHLIPQNARNFVWDYISNSNLKDNLRAIKSLHTFLIVDSCFSGSLFSQSRNINPPPAESIVAFAENVGIYPSRWCLAAGMIEEVSDGFRGENSPFAQAIISFLERNQSPKFPVSSLVQYVKRVTPNNAKQTPIGGVLFQMKDMGGEFIFSQRGVASDNRTSHVTTTDNSRGTETTASLGNTPTTININKQLQIDVPNNLFANKKKILFAVVVVALLAVGLGWYNHWSKEQAILKENSTDFYYTSLSAGDKAAREGRHVEAISNYKNARQMAISIDLPATDIEKIDEKITLSAQKGPSDEPSTNNDGENELTQGLSIYERLVGKGTSICGTSYE